MNWTLIFGIAIEGTVHAKRAEISFVQKREIHVRTWQINWVQIEEGSWQYGRNGVTLKGARRRRRRGGRQGYQSRLVGESTACYTESQRKKKTFYCWGMCPYRF